MKHIMKSIFKTTLLLLVYMLFFRQTVTAAPAAPIESNFVQPSGESFKASLGGDEWLNWAVSKDEDVLVQDTDGYWKYAEVSGDKLKPGKNKYKIHQKPKNIIKKSDLIKKIKDKKIKKSGNASTALLSSSSGGTASNTVSSGSSSAMQPSAGISQTRKIVLLLIEFSNISIKYSEADWYNRIFNTTGNSVNNYYSEVSNGIFQFSPVNESYGTANNGVIRVKLNYLHPNTGSNTGSANQKIVMDALVAADPSINYSSFDTNNDGIITDSELLIVTVVAGNEAATGGPSPSIWAHKWGFSLSTKLDGKSFGSWKGYTQQSELQYSNMATIGVLCHELGHDLGLPDLYDYDSSSQGVGIHSLMAGGSWGRVAGTSDYPPGSSPTHMDAWCKAYLGFVTPQIVESPGNYTVNSFDTGKYSVLKIPTSNPKEYFLIENRQLKGYDKALSPLYVGPSVPSGGLAIWHIDESISFYRCNDNELHKMVDLEEANEGKLGYSQLDKRLSGSYDHYFYTGSFTTFSPTTVPGSNQYNGTKTNITATVTSPCSSIMTVNITKPVILIPKGALEAPATGATVKRTSSISGWFLDSDGVMRIDVLVDGVVKGQAVYGDARADISSKYPEYNNTNCGFHYDLDVSNLSEGRHVLTIQEVSKSGVKNSLPSIEIIVENMAKTTISYTLSENAYVTVQIYNSEGILIRTLENKVYRNTGINSAKWDGRDSSNKLVDDGVYTYKITATDTSGLVSKPLTGTITIKRAPYIKSITHTPEPFNPDGSNKAVIKYVISEISKVTFSVYDRNGILIFSRENISASMGENSYEWDGRDNTGKIVSSGAYTYKVTPVDSNGNKTLGLSGTITVLVDNTPPVISSDTVRVNPFNIAMLDQDSVRINYNLSENAKVTVKIFDSNGTLVRLVENSLDKAAGSNYVYWDCKDESQKIVKDGDYKYTLQAVDSAGNSSAPVSGIIMIRSALTISSVSVTPNPYSPGGGNVLSISYAVSEPARSKITIGRIGAYTVFEKVTENSTGTVTLSWDGKNSTGSIVPDGEYYYEITAVKPDGTYAKSILGTLMITSKAVIGQKPVIDLNTFNPNPFDPTDSNTAEISYRLSESCSVTINIMDSSNAVIRVLEANTQKSAGVNSIIWDGKSSNGTTIPDGNYTYNITAVDNEGQSGSCSGSFVVKRYPISITSVSDSPDPFIPNGSNKTAIRFTLSKNASAVIRIYDKNNALVKTFTINAAVKGENIIYWDGKTESGNAVKDGSYTYTIDAEDSQGNKSNQVKGTISIDATPPSIYQHYVEPPVIEPD
ncbi:MAG: M6 family metalloprotease domain-containing protein [Clostridia bacterium]|nr:M6 family metalloprotease domain-containing protein [Clostridia bacterium]